MTTVNDKELEDLLARCFAWLPKATEQVRCTEVCGSGGGQEQECHHFWCAGEEGRKYRGACREGIPGHWTET